jgi:selenocysteine lyase/cysteine desulfurase
VAIKGVSVIGQHFSQPHRAPTIGFVMDGKTPEQVCTYLNTKNIFAWSGHFYAIRAIEILGLLERGGVTRMGMSVYTTSSEVNKALEAIEAFAGS